MSKLRILLADDHAVLRDGLKLLIDQQSDMEVVAQAATGRETVQHAVEQQPDIVLLDVSMPDMNGAEAAEKIRECCPRVRVLALTRHSDQAYLRRLLQAGAAGYVLKQSAAETLIHAIRTVAGGSSYIEPSLAGALLKRTFTQSAPPGRSPQARELLTAREEEVLQSIAWGRTNKEIAANLALSIKTVESYKAAALEKLRLRSRADIVRYAVSRGWLAEDRAPE